MGISSGFFDSLNGDRKYNVTQLSVLVSSLIKDGVFQNVGNAFVVSVNVGSEVLVGSGYGFFKHRWIQNDTLYPLNMGAAELLLDRIDAVVIEIDNTEAIRLGTIKKVKGTPSANPVRPTLVKTEFVNQYPLAYIRRPANNDNIIANNITQMVGTAECPFVIGVQETLDIDFLFAQWGGQWSTWFTALQSESETEINSLITTSNNNMNGLFEDFNAWFQNMKNQLTTDAAGNLQTQITDIKSTYLSANKYVYVAPTGSDTAGTGTSANPYRTISKAILSLPKNLNGKSMTIYVAGGEYTETTTISSSMGARFNIIMTGDVTINGSIYFFDNDGTVQISAPTGSTFTLTINNTENTNGAFVVSNSRHIYTGGLNMIIENNGLPRGISIYGGSKVNIAQNITINNTSQYAITVAQSSEFGFSNYLYGSNNAIGVRVDASKVSMEKDKFAISATKIKELVDGGIITNDLVNENDVVRTYRSVTELGLTSATCTLANIWNALPYYSELITEVGYLTNIAFPNTLAVLHMAKSASVSRKFIFELVPKEDLAPWFMGLTGVGIPSGIWTQYATKTDLGAYATKTELGVQVAVQSTAPAATQLWVW